MNAKKSNLNVMAIIALITVSLISAAVLFMVFSKTYYLQTLITIIRGEISFDQAVTRIILDRRMVVYGVPEVERRRLDEALVGIPDKLEGTAESDRRELAELILKVGSDGEIEDGELTQISEFVERISK